MGSAGDASRHAPKRASILATASTLGSMHAGTVATETSPSAQEGSSDVRDVGPGPGTRLSATNSTAAAAPTAILPT